VERFWVEGGNGGHVVRDYGAVAADYEAVVGIDWLSVFVVGYTGADYGREEI
jgi:hypothetical protein